MHERQKLHYTRRGSSRLLLQLIGIVAFLTILESKIVGSLLPRGVNWSDPWHLFICIFTIAMEHDAFIDESWSHVSVWVDLEFQTCFPLSSAREMDGADRNWVVIYVSTDSEFTHVDYIRSNLFESKERSSVVLLTASNDFVWTCLCTCEHMYVRVEVSRKSDNESMVKPQRLFI